MSGNTQPLAELQPQTTLPTGTRRVITNVAVNGVQLDIAPIVLGADEDIDIANIIPSTASFSYQVEWIDL